MTSALTDYGRVTETPKLMVTPESRSMMFSRYVFAGTYCHGRDVLEVGCGAGQGLGYLTRIARRVVGGDLTDELLQMARNHYGGSMSLSRFDALAFPFPSATFDVVILNEALYYLIEPVRFLRETRRVLRPGGVVFISTVNCEWCDFIPSPYSTTYFSSVQLRSLLERSGFSATLYAAFPVTGAGARDIVVSILRRSAVRMRLIPGTLKRRQPLKRLFLGQLVSLEPELDGDAPLFDEPILLAPHSRTLGYKILYAVGRVSHAD